MALVELDSLKLDWDNDLFFTGDEEEVVCAINIYKGIDGLDVPVAFYNNEAHVLTSEADGSVCKLNDMLVMLSNGYDSGEFLGETAMGEGYEDVIICKGDYVFDEEAQGFLNESDFDDIAKRTVEMSQFFDSEIVTMED